MIITLLNSTQKVKHENFNKSYAKPTSRRNGKQNHRLENQQMSLQPVQIKTAAPAPLTVISFFTIDGSYEVYTKTEFVNGQNVFTVSGTLDFSDGFETDCINEVVNEIANCIFM